MNISVLIESYAGTIRKTSPIKMFRENVRILALLLMFFCDRTSSECTQLTPCSCVFSNGQGYDLTSLSGMGVLNTTGPGHDFYFQPCKNARLTTNTSSECYKVNGVSLCMHDTAKKENISLGTVEESTMTMHPDDYPVLVFRHKSITTMISLLCCPPCKTEFSIESVEDPTKYNLKLTSPHACKVLLQKGLSVGSILVILFFVFGGLYFIGGAIVLSLVRGAKGWERIPNYEFWCVELPSLVREGIVVTFNCSQSDSYNRI